MANAAAEKKAASTPEVSDYEAEIRAEMAEIKNDIKALTKTLARYGKARAESVQDRASEWSDEIRDESLRAVKKVGKQVSRLEKNMEAEVKEHPLQWFLGALGMGLVITMLLRRDHN